MTPNSMRPWLIVPCPHSNLILYDKENMAYNDASFKVTNINSCYSIGLGQSPLSMKQFDLIL